MKRWFHRLISWAPCKEMAQIEGLDNGKSYMDYALRVAC